MRVLLTTQPATGHLHPLVPLARALVEAGHEVAFATSRPFCPTVEALGFRCFPVGMDWLESEAAATFPEILRMGLAEVTPWFLQELFVSRGARSALPDLLEVGRSWKPDVIVRETWEFGGCLAAEILGIPHASLSASLYFGIWEHLVTERLAALRREHGLPEDPKLEMLTRYLYLDYVPPSLHYPDLARPPVVQPLRPAVFDHAEGSALPAWVAQLPERPTVYVTMGTVFNRIPGLFGALLGALAAEPLNLIVTVGHNQDPAAFGPQPPHVHIERYIPQSLLFPHCDAIVTHGGFNTVMAALAHGLPMVVVPLAADQGQNATRVAATGMGRALPFLPEVTTLPRCEALAQGPGFSPRALRDAVMEVIETPAYRATARRLRDEALGQPGLEHAVERLARLAAQNTPRG